jgi:hypothetical protein
MSWGKLQLSLRYMGWSDSEPNTPKSYLKLILHGQTEQ